MSLAPENFLLVYMTASSPEEAERIAETLLSEQLIACANIFPPMRSVYVWEGKLEKSSEIAVIFKTRKTLFKQLEERVQDLHSYACPCLVALDLREGHHDFLKWIDASTSQALKNNS